MSYKRVTAESFIEKVRTGKYKAAVDASRAIKKSALSDEDKARCERAITAYFSKARPAAAAAAAKKKTTKKPAKKKKAAKKKASKKKAAKAPAKKAAKKKTVKKAPAKKKKTKKGKRRPNARAAKPASITEGNGLFSGTAAALNEIQVNDGHVGTLTQSLRAMKMAKDIDPKVEFGPGPQSAVDAIDAIVDKVHNTVRGSAETTDPVDPEVAARFSDSVDTAPGSQGAEG
jgi:hypothetical protein